MFNRRHFLQLSLISTGSLLGISTACSSSSSLTTSLHSMPNYSRTSATLIPDSTPRDDGFFFPAEWQPHDYTIMVFPPAQNWEDNGLEDAYEEWANVANTVQEFEPVLMVVHPDERSIARELLSSEIRLIEFPVNDGWSRDSGPTILVNNKGERRIAGFTFNGWGAKFPPYADDALLKARLSGALEIPMYPTDLVLEGGAIAVDGEGTLITTEECLLNRNRNPHLSQAEIEARLRDYLGVQKVIWLGDGIVPDPVTDGHVDGFCAFAAPGVVLLHTTDDRNDPNYRILQDAKRRLQEAKDARDRTLEIVEIPLGDDLAHMNFYIVNNGIIVPTSGDPEQDDAPLAILREVFPDREVVGVESLTLAEGGGGIHCITQQVPSTS
ncbi:agmatine deiminase family protein [Roseofilum casamattae]|nr:agmatine deiminase family protein [Roseofilum casamattae]